MLLRGVAPRVGETAEGKSSASLLGAIDDDAASEEAAGAQPAGLLIEPAGASQTDAAGGRMRPVEPLTTGSIGNGSAPIDDEGVFGGDTERDKARGIRVGRMLVFPELSLRGGASDNASGTAGGEAGSFYRVSPSLRLRSDWARHQYEFNLRGSYQGYPDNPDDDDPSLEITSTLTLDVAEDTMVQGDLNYAISSEGRSTAESAGNSGKTVLSHDIGGTLAATREVGLITARLRGAVEGSAYSGGTGTNRNNVLASTGLRLGYGTGATISPFVETVALGRLYEDAPGRDALGYELRGGLAIDRGEKLSGEIAVGYHFEDLEGQAFKNLEGILVEAEMIWSPSRLSTVTFNASTAFEATALSSASGSVVYGGDITLAHSLTRDLAVDLGGSASYRTYQGLDLNELTLSGTTGATYAINSYAALQARYTYDWFDSSQAGSDYSSNTIEAGVRLRR